MDFFDYLRITINDLVDGFRLTLVNLDAREFHERVAIVFSFGFPWMIYMFQLFTYEFYPRPNLSPHEVFLEDFLFSVAAVHITLMIQYIGLCFRNTELSHFGLTFYANRFKELFSIPSIIILTSILIIIKIAKEYYLFHGYSFEPYYWLTLLLIYLTSFSLINLLMGVIADEAQLESISTNHNSEQ